MLILAQLRKKQYMKKLNNYFTKNSEIKRSHFELLFKSYVSKESSKTFFLERIAAIERFNFSAR